MKIKQGMVAGSLLFWGNSSIADGKISVKNVEIESERKDEVIFDVSNVNISDEFKVKCHDSNNVLWSRNYQSDLREDAISFAKGTHIVFEHIEGGVVSEYNVNEDVTIDNTPSQLSVFYNKKIDGLDLSTLSPNIVKVQ